MKTEIVFQQREIEVIGTEERRMMFSLDGRSWWSDVEDYARYQLRRRREGKKLRGGARRDVTLERL